MYILGIHNSGWLSSAALIRDGEILAACPEERLNRQKLSRVFPLASIQYCLESEGITLADVDHVALGWNPGINVASRYRGGFSERLRYAGEWLYSVPNHILGRMMPLEVESTEQIFQANGSTARLHHVTHHNAHAANAYYLSPFSESAIFTADAYGERNSTTWKRGEGEKLIDLKTIDFPQSLGCYYSALTEFLGFRPDSDEWKVMGLAPYGDPSRYRGSLEQLIRALPEGAFELDLTYFNHYNFDTEHMFSLKMEEVLGPRRQAGDDVDQRHRDLAAAMQESFENILFHCLEHLHRIAPSDNLCLSGGCLMNSVFNGKVEARSPFSNTYISFSPDDSGNSMGAALALYHHLLGNPREPREVTHAYWGPEWDGEAIEAVLRKYKLPVRKMKNTEEETAELLVKGRIVGWFQGKMEFGQRALGNRSILADPREARMKEVINAAVKYREAFRPFAPSILEERTADYFEVEEGTRVPFMERVYPIRPEMRDKIPAVTHVDGSGRLQTVSQADNPRYHGLIQAFERLTGVPVVLNTSFNVMGEPVVCSPEDAIRTFNTCGIDDLVLGDYHLSKHRTDDESS